MRRRQPGSSTALPPDIAAGPDPRRWGPGDVPHKSCAGYSLTYASERDFAAHVAWNRAGREWSLANGWAQNGWLSLLPEAVRYADTIRGRLQIVSGRLTPPWDAS